MGVWRREGDAWRVEEYGQGEAIRLESLDVVISVAAIYENSLATAQ